MKFMSNDFKQEFNENYQSIINMEKGYNDSTLYKEGKLINRLGFMQDHLKDDPVNDIISRFMY